MPLSCAWVGGAETSSSYLPNIRFVKLNKHSVTVKLRRQGLWHRINAFDLYRPAFDEAQALERGRQLVADFEGAILLARIYGEPGYIDGVTRRALEQLAG